MSIFHTNSDEFVCDYRHSSSLVCIIYHYKYDDNNDNIIFICTNSQLSKCMCMSRIINKMSSGSSEGGLTLDQRNEEELWSIMAMMPSKTILRFGFTT